MRKHIKEQLTNLINTIGEAHKEIIRQSNIGQEQHTDEIVTILTSCQDAAIMIGTKIEESEGEGTETVRLLEEYCEQLYNVSCHIPEEGFVLADAVEKLEQKLKIIAESLDNEIKVRKEVVFLPYKASMWDSLESVWKKMDADPEWDAYVVPIPYYDKKPDGSFGELHYEGNEYPQYVPITNYEKYDIANIRPDAIYIHNPYDECNFVTSVHPFFYAKNLKQYTEQLVYIPYFVLGDIDPDNEEQLEGMSHFVTVPGVVHAHRVIVQSENIRRAYINVMTKFAGEHTRTIWENKIEGTGSPKFDKIAGAKKEDYEIPDDWKALIYKNDGTRKKIIMYNTSVNALLQHSDKYIGKMKKVFETFKAYKEEVALWWRPHPLIKATISSMRPELWEQYEELVCEYINEKWGIYDDTADLDRAIVLCDAYYGDGSSVVQLCQSVGKPVMVQNVEV